MSNEPLLAQKQTKSQNIMLVDRLMDKDQKYLEIEELSQPQQEAYEQRM